MQDLITRPIALWFRRLQFVCARAGLVLIAVRFRASRLPLVRLYVEMLQLLAKLCDRR